MARLSDPIDSLPSEARRVYEKIAAKRGAVRGPFASLMHDPELALRVGDLGEYLRFGGSLPGDVRELAVLVTARAIDQPYEWVAHAKIARAEKLPEDVIELVRTRGDLGTLPRRLADPARVVQHVIALESIPRELQDRVEQDLGLGGLMELVVLVGHYRLIAGVLFAFDTPLPDGATPPF
jgi:4-carboxymuconolactone decarboxylase